MLSWRLVRGAALVLGFGVVAGCAHGSDDEIGDGSGGAPTTDVTIGNGGAATGDAPNTTTTNGSGGAGGMSSTDATTSTSTSSTTSSTTSTTSSTTSTTSGSGPGSLFFSEYVEGTSNNKALEIVNTTSSSINLGDCQIDRYQNGGTSTTNPSIVLDSVSLAPGHVFVLCHTSFAMPSKCDQLHGSLAHNGNDAIVLTCNGMTMDSFGQVGVDAIWGTSPTISEDATLRRKCSVNTGDVVPTNAFDPATEWDGFAVDTFTGLGTYSCP